MLAGEGEAAVGPSEQVVLLVVDEGGISPPLIAALHLEVVEEPGGDFAQVELSVLVELSHAQNCLRLRRGGN